jgi:hypothetical protein
MTKVYGVLDKRPLQECYRILSRPKPEVADEHRVFLGSGSVGFIREGRQRCNPLSDAYTFSNASRSISGPLRDGPAASASSPSSADVLL